MARCTKLRNNFYSMDLYYGKTMLMPYREFCCFLIVEHCCDKKFMRQQALELLLSQCIDYEFYGTYSREWRSVFDEVYRMLYPKENEKTVIISLQENIDDFVDSLQDAIRIRPLVPFDIYLIYDDETKYQTVLKKLEEKEVKSTL